MHALPGLWLRPLRCQQVQQSLRQWRRMWRQGQNCHTTGVEGYMSSGTGNRHSGCGSRHLSAAVDVVRIMWEQQIKDEKMGEHTKLSRFVSVSLSGRLWCVVLYLGVGGHLPMSHAQVRLSRSTTQKLTWGMCDDTVGHAQDVWERCVTAQVLQAVVADVTQER